MNSRTLTLACSLLLTVWPALADGSGGNESVYTELSGEKCQASEANEEGAGASLRCPGVAGFALVVLDDDDRMSIDLEGPGGEVSPLDYWSVVTHGFSTLGQKAEWRVGQGGKPFALIVRVNASEDPEDSSKITSYLSVAKITPQKICVTARIPPIPKANEAAREAADRAAGEPCLESP